MPRVARHVFVRCTVVSLAVGAAGGGAVAAVPSGPHGRLVQPRGAAGCMNTFGGTGCARAPELRQPERPAISPDGRHLYVPITRSDAVMVYARNARTGALRRLRGKRGCIKNRGGGGCGSAYGMARPIGAAISPDGKTVYVLSVGADSVTAFARNRRSGGLRQLTGGRGCASRLRRPRCVHARVLNEPIDIKVSPDGQRVYTAARRFPGGVAIFERRSDGSLRQRAGAGGCVSPQGRQGCAPARAFRSPWALVVSGDSGNVYVAAAESNAVAVLQRTPTGLTQETDTSGCVATTPDAGCEVGRGLKRPSGIAISPDGRSVYVAAFDSNAVASLDRAPSTGVLTQTDGAAGCVSADDSEGCAPGRALEGVHAVVVSPDGDNVYGVSETLDSIAAFSRARPDGALTQLAAQWGCLSRFPVPGCPSARGMSTAVTVTATGDGKNLYITSENFPAGGIAIFRRMP